MNSAPDSLVKQNAENAAVSGSSRLMVRPSSAMEEVAHADLSVGDGQNLQLRRLHQYMRGYYWLALLLLVICGAGGAYAGFRNGKKVYASTGLIQVMPVVPKLMYSVEDKGTLPMFDSFVESQAAMMQSQRVMRMAMDDEEWKSLGRGNSDRSEEDYASEITITHEGGMLRVQAVDPDPNAARINVSTLINAYLKLFDERDKSSGENRIELLNQRKIELTSALNSRQDRILTIASAYNAEDLTKEFDFEQQRQHTLVSLIDEKGRLLAAINRSSSTTRPVDGKLSDEQLASNNPRFANLLEQRDDYKRRLMALDAEGFLPKSPDVVELKKLQSENESEIQEQRSRLQSQYAGGLPSPGYNSAPMEQQQLTDELNGLEKQRANIDDTLKSMGKDVLEIQKLRNEASEIQADRDETDRRIQQLQVEGQISGRLEVISDGDRPMVPYRDTRITYSAAGGFGGGMLGFCMVAAFAFMDRRLRSPDQAEGGAINAPILGMLPRLPNDLSDPAQAVMAAHCVHEIRTLLQIWSRRSRHRVFAITSPNPGAGKSSLTLALGASYATANLRTLIVDCDLVGGGLTRRAELIIKRMLGQVLLREGIINDDQLAEALKLASENGKQIGQVLLDQGLITPKDLEFALTAQIEQPIGILDAMHGFPVDQCVARTSIPNLQILPVGAATARDVPLLSPEALQQLIESLGKQFDVVLVDTGPILGSLEASLIAGIVDGVVLTIRKGDRRPTFERAMSQLLTVGARVAGVVFNGASSKDILTYGRASSSARSHQGSANGNGMESVAVGSQSPRNYGPLTSAVADFAPAIIRNPGRN